MGLSWGLVGLPNVGKSTLFNALTRANVPTSIYPFCTIEPHKGVVQVPDERLYALANIVKPERIIPAVIEFWDIAGLIKGSSKGEGLGNEFLSHIRSVDGILHIVRCFDSPNIPALGEGDPLKDIELINIELALSDLTIVEKRLDKLKSLRRVGKGDPEEEAQLEIIRERLLRGESIRDIPVVKDLPLLSWKPVIYVANTDSLDNPKVLRLINWGKEKGEIVIPVLAKIEEELGEFSDEERMAFLKDGYGVEESTLHRLVREAYRLLGLISFFTIWSKEVRAWTVLSGTKAPQAAGKIHSDFEKNFVKVEVIPVDKLILAESWSKARELGYIRIEGKEYVVKDGDVLYFKAG
ncbi:MAG: redox-regulated ATPase YchF [bacterium]|nr:redox-regulated ATPase YchF [bacterium]